MTALAGIVGILAALLVIYPILVVFAFLKARKQQTVYLAVTPPSFSHKTPLATEQLTRMLQSLIATRTLKERLLLQYRVASLELVSTRKDGIRYIFCLPHEDAPVFTQQLTAYLPDVRVKEVTDPLAGLQDSPRLYVKEFKQARHYAYPLAANETLAQHDPIAYITGAMTRPADGEQIVYQLVVSATWPRSVSRIRNKLALGQDPNLYSAALPLPVRILFWLIRLPFVIFTSVFEMVGEMLAPSYRSPKYHQARLQKQQPAYLQTPAIVALDEACRVYLPSATVKQLIVALSKLGVFLFAAPLNGNVYICHILFIISFKQRTLHNECQRNFVRVIGQLAVGVNVLLLVDYRTNDCVVGILKNFVQIMVELTLGVIIEQNLKAFFVLTHVTTVHNNVGIAKELLLESINLGTYVRIGGFRKQ